LRASRSINCVLQSSCKTFIIPWVHAGYELAIVISYPTCVRSCQGGGSHVARLNFKMSRAGVYKCLSLMYCRLCRHWRNLAEGGCLLSRFHFTRCCYFLGHVACQNLPLQDLKCEWNNCFIKFTSTKYWEFFPTLFVKITYCQLVFNFEQTRTITTFGEHGTMAHIPWWLSQWEL